MQIFAWLQVRGRTSVGYGENSTALNITLSAEGQTGKKKNKCFYWSDSSTYPFSLLQNE